MNDSRKQFLQVGEKILLQNGELIDVTREQYPEEAIFTRVPVDLKGFTSVREKRLSDADTARRYQLLKQRVKEVLG